MTFDPDLEAKMRSSLMSILDGSSPGEGVSLWRGVLGLCPGCPEGGEWWRGLLAPSICHLPFLEKGWDFAFLWISPGLWILLSATDADGPWTLLSFLIFCHCHGSLLIGEGQSQTRHPRTRQIVFLFFFNSELDFWMNDIHCLSQCTNVVHEMTYSYFNEHWYNVNDWTNIYTWMF